MGDAPITVTAEGLGKEFGEKVALRDLSLSLHRGEIFGLLGPNGAGKSTTLNLWMGFLKPTRGRATVCGLDCTRDHRAVMTRVGHLPEEPTLFDNLTGRELLSFVLTMRGLSKAERWRALDAWAERLGFAADLDQLVAGYSMGMRKKLALLAAMAHQPEVLLLDEPTNGLDPLVAREVRDMLVEQAAAGVTVVLSTHLLDVAERVCHRLGVIVRGELRALGDASEILAATGAGTLEEAFLALTAAPRSAR